MTIDEIVIKREGGKWRATAINWPTPPRPNRAHVVFLVGAIDGDTLGEATYEMLRVIRGERYFPGPPVTYDDTDLPLLALPNEETP